MGSKVLILETEEMIWKLIEKARQGNTVRMIGVGHSMVPLLRGEKDYIDLQAIDLQTRIKKNDVVLYQSHTGNYVLHRVLKVKDGLFYMNGDGNLTIEPGLERKDIYLKAIGFLRGHSYIDVQSLGYRIYCVVWSKTLPVRKYLFLGNKLWNKICRRTKRENEV